MTERKDVYILTPDAAAARYALLQQALTRALRELTDARAEIEALRAEVDRLKQALSQAQEDERERCAAIAEAEKTCVLIDEDGLRYYTRIPSWARRLIATAIRTREEE